MRLNRKSLNLQRRQLDKRIKSFLRLKTEVIPSSGWIKSIRESLGMPAAILAKKLNVAQPNVAKMEHYEAQGSITLNTLEKAANALHCDLKYVLIPQGNFNTLEEILEVQALKAAKKEMMEVTKTMVLENQVLDKKDILFQTKVLAKELKEKLSSKIWED